MPSPGLNLAKLLGTSSTLSANDLDLGVIKQYATFSDLPVSVADGERGYITATSNLYIYLDGAWYIMTHVNQDLTSLTGVNSTYNLATDGTPTLVIPQSTDPEGLPITYGYSVTSGSLTNGGGATAIVAQGTGDSSNYFNVIPSLNASYQGTFQLTFSATDGVNTAVTSAANFELVILPTFNYLVVGGGGSGGGRHGSGGGAGEYNEGTYTAVGGTTYNVSVGQGAPQTGSNSAGAAGFQSSIAGGALSITSGGGGGGSTYGSNSSSAIGSTGGNNTSSNPPTPSGSGFANRGGNGAAAGGGSGGGGGAGANGSNASGAFGGAGGVGKQWVDSTYYAGGGGGGSDTAHSASGGNGGGAAGGRNQGTAAVAHKGGGGGGGRGAAWGGNPGGAGGSGIIKIRLDASVDQPTVTGNPTITTVGSYKFYQWIYGSSGTFYWT